jgi:hypothetical protein
MPSRKLTMSIAAAAAAIAIGGGSYAIASAANPLATDTSHPPGDPQATESADHAAIRRCAFGFGVRTAHPPCLPREDRAG